MLFICELCLLFIQIYIQRYNRLARRKSGCIRHRFHALASYRCGDIYRASYLVHITRVRVARSYVQLVGTCTCMRAIRLRPILAFESLADFQSAKRSFRQIVMCTGAPGNCAPVPGPCTPVEWATADASRERWVWAASNWTMACHKVRLMSGAMIHICYL
jgi:hypothetical protein